MEEIRAWAFESDSPWPGQDFDLSVAELHFADLIIELSCDASCPKKDFFLSCAYIIVGDAVMTEYETRSKAGVEQFLQQIKATNNERLLTLYKLGTKLVATPSSFDYDFWCGEGCLAQYKVS
ncbi:hypothetical protein PRUB_a0647 [Pseudoalteromonas rubra]|uniref:Uncharacterized protein n=2 Tax=Pseudoalteromonas rubra TaxID=43658 RepID=A0A8T0C651_9GAMM|nr:hypothetical protein PRUB_a0647 [Pseudoalteromonas rubra]